MNRSTELRLEVRSPTGFTNREILVMNLLGAFPGLLLGALLTGGSIAVIGAMGNLLLGGDKWIIIGGESVSVRDFYFPRLMGVGSAALACSCPLLFFEVLPKFWARG